MMDDVAEWTARIRRWGTPAAFVPQARDPKDDDHKTQQGHEPGDSTTEEKHFVLEPDCVQFEDVQCHHLGACPGQPSTGRGRGNAMPNGETDVARCLYDRPEAMVISALTSCCRGHATMIARFAF